MWQYAVWGAVGAAVNRALIFMEANRRAKGPAWRYPDGPGGGFFLLASALHCAIGVGITLAAAPSGIIATPLLALGLGAVAPAAMAKIGRYALATLDPAPPGVDGEGEE
jgi:hypothetical protein